MLRSEVALHKHIRMHICFCIFFCLLMEHTHIVNSNVSFVRRFLCCVLFIRRRRRHRLFPFVPLFILNCCFAIQTLVVICFCQSLPSSLLGNSWKQLFIYTVYRHKVLECFYRITWTKDFNKWELTAMHIWVTRIEWLH